MEFSEIYCSNCKKTLGKYNVKFYTDEKIGEVIKTSHISHVKSGHQIIIKKIKNLP